MRGLELGVAAVASAVALVACGGGNGDGGDDDTGPRPAVIELPDIVRQPMTFHRETVYVVRGMTDLYEPVTIEPGTVVKLAPGGELWAHGGTLHAVGTADQPIVFTSIDDDDHGGDTEGDGPPLAAPRHWRSILLRAEGSELAYCQILHGGDGVQVGAVTFERPAILRDSVVAHANVDYYGGAVVVAALGGGARIEHNVFFDNSRPIFLNEAATVVGNVFHDPDGVGGPNVPNEVDIAPTGNPFDPDVPVFDHDVTLSVTEVPVVAIPGIVVEGAGVLRLGQDTVLKLTDHLDVPSAGALVLGTGALLTSIRDDGHGATVPGHTGPAQPGDWNGVWNADTASWMVDARFLYSTASTP